MPTDPLEPLLRASDHLDRLRQAAPALEAQDLADRLGALYDEQGVPTQPRERLKAAQAALDEMGTLEPPSVPIDLSKPEVDSPSSLGEASSSGHPETASPSDTPPARRRLSSALQCLLCAAFLGLFPAFLTQSKAFVDNMAAVSGDTPTPLSSHAQQTMDALINGMSRLALGGAGLLLGVGFVLLMLDIRRSLREPD
jgi:hypothetical protein